MASSFQTVFHSCVINRGYLEINDYGELSEQKQKAVSLETVLKGASAVVGELESYNVEKLSQLIQDTNLLLDRYNKHIHSCSWKFKRFICMILTALRIFKVNPYVQHQVKTEEAFGIFLRKLEQLKKESEFSKGKAESIELTDEDKQISNSGNPTLIDQTKPEKAESIEEDKLSLIEQATSLLKNLEADIDLHVTEVHLQQQLVTFRNWTQNNPLEINKEELKNKHKGNLELYFLAKLEGSERARELLLGLSQHNRQYPREVEGKLCWLDLKEPIKSSFAGAQLSTFHADGINLPVKRELQLIQAGTEMDVLKKLIKSSEKVPTELKNFRKINVNQDFIKLLPWISSKEPVELDCSAVDLSEEQLQMLTLSFPVIRKLDLRGTSSADQKVSKFLLNLPYLKHLVLDAANNIKLLKNQIAIYCLFPSELQVGNQTEVIEVHYNDPKCFQERYLVYGIPHPAKEFLSKEIYELFLSLFNKKKAIEIRDTITAEAFLFLFQHKNLKVEQAQTIFHKSMTLLLNHFNQNRVAFAKGLKSLSLREVGILNEYLVQMQMQQISSFELPADESLTPFFEWRIYAQGLSDKYCDQFDQLVYQTYLDMMA